MPSPVRVPISTVLPPVQADRLLHDGETVSLGGMTLSVHFSPGHTPGNMSWTWTDLRAGKPVRIAYVDRVSAPGYQLIDSPRYPRITDDYRASIATSRALPCDLLLTPYLWFSGWNYADVAGPQPTPTTCRAFADSAEKVVAADLADQYKAAR